MIKDFVLEDDHMMFVLENAGLLFELDIRIFEGPNTGEQYIVPVINYIDKRLSSWLTRVIFYARRKGLIDLRGILWRNESDD